MSLSSRFARLLRLSRQAQSRPSRPGWRLLASAVVGMAFVDAALGQCDRWLHGNSFAGPAGEVNAVEFWDPDGPGPREPILVFAGSFAVAGDAPTRCIGAWDPATRGWSTLESGLEQAVRSLAVLPSGDLLVGGDFYRTYDGTQHLYHVARRTPSGWEPLGQGIGTTSTSDSVRALLVLADGRAVAGGTFSEAGGIACSNIAIWDGSAWSSLGGVLGVPSSEGVFALAQLPDGRLVAAGRFSVSGVPLTANIAVWDGVSWAAMGSGLSGSGAAPGVNALCVTASGDLVAGGLFTNSGPTAISNLARWDGAAWQPLGSGTDGAVLALHNDANGDLLVGGDFTVCAGVACPYAARYDGASWSAVGAELNDQVRDFAQRAPEDLFLGGRFAFSFGEGEGAWCVARQIEGEWDAIGQSTTEGTMNSVVALPSGGFMAGGTDAVVEWNGVNATRIGTVLGDVFCVARASNGLLYAGGQVSRINDIPMSVGVWDGAQWSDVGGGVSAGVVVGMATLPDGTLVVGGQFASAGGVPASNIAAWDGVQWRALSSGVNGRVQAMISLPDGGVGVGGLFTSAGGITVNRIARWSGDAWSGYANGFNGGVTALAAYPNGDLAASGSFTSSGTIPVNRLARWDGSAWSSLGWAATQNAAKALVVMPNGDLVGSAVVSFSGQPRNLLARWDGNSWSPIGSAFTDTSVSLAVLADGELVAAMSRGQAGEWAGGSWARYTQTGVPWIVAQPLAADVNVAGTAGFIVAPASDYDFDGPLAYEWQMEDPFDPDGWRRLADGPLVIAGEEVAQVAGSAGPELLVTPGSMFGPASFRSIVSNGCGAVTSQAALLTVFCLSDFDRNGQSDFFDYLDFAGAFSAEDPRADVDGNGQVDFFDYLEFVRAFSEGC